MAHEITQNAITGLFEFAYNEAHGPGWHGEGQMVKLADTQDLSKWIEQSGMQWEAKRQRVRYQVGQTTHAFEGAHILLRSDTHEPLSIVGPGYKIVQPKEVVLFFKGLLGLAGLEMSACGTLFGGREFWCTAKFKEGHPLSRADMVTGYVLVHTSLDGSFATTVRMVLERAVCKNTVRMAFSEAQRKGSVYKITHRSEFDADEARAFLGLGDDAWNNAKSAMLKLANKKITKQDAEDLSARLFGATDAAKLEKVVQSAGFNKVLALFNGAGMGSDMDGVKDTANGWLQAVTEYADHHIRARSDANRWSSAQFGAGADLKDKAVDLAMAIATA